MDSEESYHSESEFYYSNEEDKENNAVREYFRFIIENLEINKISIYTLSDLGVLSNLIGSLSLANEHYSPPTE